MKKPRAIDLYAGLGGWTEGLLAEGFDVVGFDIERHVYGEHRYPAQLVLQDVRTIHGSQFRDASLIVASSPCQEFSYRAMPWSRAKALGPPLLGMELFAQAERIQREAIAAAGHFIPMVQENVRGAQKYVGRAKWHYGSYYLWGDVPALMPMTGRRAMKDGITHRSDGSTSFRHGGLPDHIKVGDRNKGRGEDKHLWTTGWNVQAVRDMKADDAIKNSGGSWFNVAHNTTSGHGQNPDGRVLDGVKVPSDSGGRRTDIGNGARFTSTEDGTKQHKSGRHWFADPDSISGSTGSKSNARKAASARIAKIPFELARWIAHCYYPR